MKSFRGVTLVCLASLTVLALSGCGLIVKNAVENATGVHTDASGKKVTVTTPNGTASISSDSGKLPDGLPSDVPSYAGTIKASAAVNTGKGTNFTYTIDTNDSVATISAWYKEKLASQGWTVTLSASSGPDQAIFEAKKGEQTTIMITIGKNDSGGNEIATIVGIQK